MPQPQLFGRVLTASSLLILTFSYFAAAATTTTCYWQDGSVASDYNRPCANSAGTYTCCSAGTACLSNGMCQDNTSKALTRGACSDKTWQSTACLNQCASTSNTFAAISACIPASVGNFCCGASTCCSTTANLFHIGDLSKATILPLAVISTSTSSSVKASSTNSATTSASAAKTTSDSTTDSKTSSTGASPSTTGSTTAKTSDTTKNSSVASQTGTTASTTTSSSSSSTPSATQTDAASDGAAPGLSTGGKAGVAIGAIGGVVIIVSILMFWLRHRRQTKINNERITQLEAKAQTKPGSPQASTALLTAESKFEQPLPFNAHTPDAYQQPSKQYKPSSAPPYAQTQQYELSQYQNTTHNPVQQTYNSYKPTTSTHTYTPPQPSFVEMDGVEAGGAYKASPPPPGFVEMAGNHQEGSPKSAAQELQEARLRTQTPVGNVYTAQGQGRNGRDMGEIHEV